MTVELLDYVEDYLNDVPEDVVAKFLWFFDRIERDGEQGLHEMIVARDIKKIRGQKNVHLFELRVMRKIWYRVFFIKKSGGIVCGHGIVKKNRQTNQRDIETATKRLKPYL